MGRPFYPHEADDPDLDWLVSNFLYERPEFVPVDTGSQPLMLLPYNEPPASLDEPSQAWEEDEEIVPSKK